MNRDKSEFGGGDYEKMIFEELYMFCKEGNIIKIECMTYEGFFYYSLGEIVICDVNKGFFCVNVDNVFVFCLDYKIRYFC